MLAKYGEEDLVDLRQLHQSLLNNGVKLRCVLDLAVSTFALDHPLRVYIPVSSQAVAMSAGGSSWDRFLVWKVFRQKADQKIRGESVMEPEH